MHCCFCCSENHLLTRSSGRKGRVGFFLSSVLVAKLFAVEPEVETAGPVVIKISPVLNISVSLAFHIHTKIGLCTVTINGSQGEKWMQQSFLWVKMTEFLLESDLQGLLIMMLRNPKLIFLSVALFSFSAATLSYLLSTRRQKWGFTSTFTKKNCTAGRFIAKWLPLFFYGFIIFILPSTSHFQGSQGLHKLYLT